MMRLDGHGSDGQHYDDGIAAPNNGQASPNRRPTAGDLGRPGNRSGGEEHSGLGPARGGRLDADISTEIRSRRER